MNFQDRIISPNKDQILHQEGYFIWCGSAAKAEDGKYHLFASRWPISATFRGWLTTSSIIRCESDKPEGPYEIKEELKVLKTQGWSSKMVHNPTVKKIGDRYYLFYVGTTYDDNAPDITEEALNHPARYNQKIGIAVAKKLEGPWEPSVNNPILSPRPNGFWDCTFTTNPSVFVESDSEIRLIYKTRVEDDLSNSNKLILGIAVANNPEGPYERKGPSPLFKYSVEDPFIWKEKGKYWMVVKDMTGILAGVYNGVLFTSEDGFNWEVAPDKLAYDHKIEYTDGSVENHKHVERPQLLVVDDKPICIFTAVGDAQTYSFNLARRLKDTY